MVKGNIKRHIGVGLFSAVFLALFAASRAEWLVEHQVWRATGDAALILLSVTLAVGPLARIWRGAAPLLIWRRELGIWFGILSLAHTVLVMQVWLQWDVQRFFGYEFVPQLGRYARLESGFGLSNAVGAVALFVTTVLVATSSDWAVRKLGASVWKWLQYGAYTVFYLVGLHAFYFLFIHYTQSFHREPPAAPSWFQLPFLGLILAVLALQVAGFIKTSLRKGEPRDTQAETLTTKRAVKSSRKVNGPAG